MTYLLLKLLHIASIIAFLGNITTGLFWHAHAARTRDPKILAHVVDGIIRSDRLFTAPGAIGATIAGFALAIHLQLPILRTGWILWTLIVFIISGLLFAFRVAPLQLRLRAYAREGESGGSFEYSRYRALAVRWEAWGVAAVLTPLAGLVFMVLKPNL